MIHHGWGADCVAESSVAKTELIRSGSKSKSSSILRRGSIPLAFLNFTRQNSKSYQEVYNEDQRKFSAKRGGKRACISARDDRLDVCLGLFRKSGKRSLHTGGLCRTD